MADTIASAIKSRSERAAPRQRKSCCAVGNSPPDTATSRASASATASARSSTPSSTPASAEAADKLFSSDLQYENRNLRYLPGIATTIVTSPCRPGASTRRGPALEKDDTSKTLRIVARISRADVHRHEAAASTRVWPGVGTSAGPARS